MKPFFLALIKDGPFFLALIKDGPLFPGLLWMGVFRGQFIFGGLSLLWLDSAEAAGVIDEISWGAVG